ncbi:mesaconyl-C(4)-CoA hydratase [Polymorphobacter glacialis]|uniref:Mesaconyl-C(4)-CoA hydratase n=1 Tax=Sandarakinorhabdus glacialis TaxID=1614636 RepID=A0A916ZZT6_9SPHN|nr:MaoC family dehydratase N-terminal domain-containing protein [Polymorphobacter glacialis]GGE20193.1 mesaconyl-C(4)-CoA hydratase [Polymorphobacter glacialis]
MVEQADGERGDDVCALPLVRRMAALLDRDPAGFSDGDALPRGWHVALFNPPTRQSELRADGAAHLGVTLPDLGMPRLMMGGRRMEFAGDIAIGSRVLRTSRLGTVTIKTGRSGRFALVDVQHRINVDGDDVPVLIETTSYVLREQDSSAPASVAPKMAVTIPPAKVSRTIVPDETMLFRYSAITDNPHRIHYDLKYARSEGYPALIVNGTVPTMLLLEMFRAHSGGEPAGWHSRNLAPIFCGVPLTLTLAEDDNGCVMRAYGPLGEVALEARAWQ